MGREPESTRLFCPRTPKGCISDILQKKKKKIAHMQDLLLHKRLQLISREGGEKQ